MSPDDHTRTGSPDPLTHAFDPALDAGLGVAFGTDPTPGGWSQPPLLRDDPSENAPLVQPSSAEMPRGAGDRYQLLGEIARGGMGVVIKGRDPDLGRDLAFKVLRTELADRPAAVQRLVEEAQVSGQLQHPGIVPVYDLGRFADGRPYFAMKLVKGRTLADLLADRPSPAADRGRFLRHFLQVCQTVAYAHSRGVIHRDLKPANVMVGAFDEVLVMDWGLAKVLPRGGVADEERAHGGRPPAGEPDDRPTEIRTARFGSGSETAAGSVMGTPAFMPPEQAGGEVDKLDERADVFGLGAILCVVLTGQPPFVGASGEAVRLMAVRGQSGECFGRLDGCGADAELVAVCKRCLAADRDARPRAAGEVSAAVAGYLAGVEDRAKRAELERAAAEAEATEQRRKRRWQVAAAVAVGLLAVGGGAFAWWQDRQETQRAAERDRERAAVEEVVGAAVDQTYRDLSAGRWIEARLSLQRGEDRLSGGEWPAPLREQLAAARRDLDTAFALEETRLIATGYAEGEFPVDFDRAADTYRRLLENYGLPVLTLDADQAARQVRDSRIASHLVVALDEWAMAAVGAEFNRQPVGLITVGEVPLRLQTVAQKADHDPWRAAVREAAIGMRADRLRELAADAAAAGQPPAAVLRLARVLSVFDGWPATINLLRKARARHPSDFWLNFYLGVVWLHSDDEHAASQAIGYLRVTVVLRPQSPVALLQLAAAISAQGDTAEVVEICREIVRLAPKFSEAYLLLGRALRDQGELAQAIKALEVATRSPDLREVREELEELRAAQLENRLKALRSPDAAVVYYADAIRSDPEDARAHNALAWVLATGPDRLRNGREAVRLASRACELTGWKDAPYIDTLAAAYAEAGVFDKAVEYQHKAMSFPAFAGQAGAAARLRLDMYTRKEPYRVKPRPAVAPPPRGVDR